MNRIVDEAERALGKKRCYGWGDLEGSCVREALPDRPWCRECDGKRRDHVGAKMKEMETEFDRILDEMEKSGAD